ncbi:FecR family protein [Chitinophaga alhagiae]|uniref:FecR family protein n=1 Tax=Chitinophaga alhagiae TaxID=2203219 RepID=UPI000E5BAB3D|nr:FecR domain-containing protein [Chitinophaga alhagiae]
MKEERFYTLMKRLTAGKASEKEQAELQQLVQEDEQLALLYREFFPGGEAAEHDDDSEALLAYSAHYARMQIAGLFDAAPEPARGRQRRMYLLPAAACVLVLLLAGGWWFGLREKTPAGREVKTQKGARTHLVLADGTAVWLNANSSITHSPGFNRTNRELTLTGEAYFKVAPDADRPFIIQAGGLKVKVLGTTFNIRSYPDEPNIETTLETGSVEITLDDQPGNKIQLKPGQKLSVDNTTSKMAAPGIPADSLEAPMLLLSKMRVDTAGNSTVDAAWKEGKLVFDGDDFQRVVSKIEKWYNVTVVLENKNLYTTSFTGVFDNKSLTTVLNTLQETGKLAYRLENDTVYVR